MIVPALFRNSQALSHISISVERSEGIVYGGSSMMNDGGPPRRSVFLNIQAIRSAMHEAQEVHRQHRQPGEREDAEAASAAE